jgi:hypothetical protein
MQTYLVPVPMVSFIRDGEGSIVRVWCGGIEGAGEGRIRLPVSQVGGRVVSGEAGRGLERREMTAEGMTGGGPWLIVWIETLGGQ